MIHNSDIVRDIGSYKCKATNIVGNVEAEAKINKPGMLFYIIFYYIFIYLLCIEVKKEWSQDIVT